MLVLLLIALKLGTRLTTSARFLIIITEIALINLVIAFNGAAANPYNAVLLLPVVVAFLILPTPLAIFSLVFGVGAQIAQLFGLNANAHHSAMHDHYVAMILSFTFTGVVVAISIIYLRKQLTYRDEQVRKLREEQLRNEQLLAIGTAAAQLTHDVATPAQTIRLLLEELDEKYNNDLELSSLNEQFSRIEARLNDWRVLADNIRAQKTSPINIQELWRDLQNLIAVLLPEQEVIWQGHYDMTRKFVLADPTLLPALFSILMNAHQGAQEALDSTIEVKSEIVGPLWVVVVTNAITNDLPKFYSVLGKQIMPSAHGLGIGAVITNATIERFHGNVSWQMKDHKLVTRVELPLKNENLNS
ncbi:MAG: two component signal transduction system histidine kinase RegB [Idiomarinaceae bacterium HL-53]|nr:MAG: two component signal transduction system histidine kinase RegB [Idiomarinaceae bacterium HL-53]CUS48061.1 signal transduction histidine kinase [Idiomarinaceae bacterium HL-53]